jgi:hypothetical protein
MHILGRSVYFGIPKIMVMVAGFMVAKRLHIPMQPSER